jgi:hypothetical protein
VNFFQSEAAMPKFPSSRGRIAQFALSNSISGVAHMPARKIGTYTIYLCRNGKRFKTLPKVAENIPRPTIGKTIGDVTGKWRVRSVINDGTSAIAIDGEGVPEPAHDVTLRTDGTSILNSETTQK